MASTVVVGIGNTLMADEAVGVFLLHKLIEAAKAEPARFSDVDFDELGTAGLGLLHSISGYRRAIIIDCAKMQMPAGSIRRFTPDDVQTVKHMRGESLHEGDMLRVIELARTLNTAPEEIVIFGIEPEVVEVREGLSNSISSKMDEYVEVVITELTNF